MTDNEVKKPRCHIPWQQMVIDSTGSVAPCSYWSGFGNDNGLMGNVYENSIMEIWNSEKYQNLRTHMAAGDLVKAGCSGCYALKNKLELGLNVEDETAPDTPYHQNKEILVQEVATGQAKLAAKPTVISFTPSHACNFRCTHCYQEDTRSSVVKKDEVYSEFLSLVPTLTQLTAGGGEPFIQPFWKKFLEEFNSESNPYLIFATATNASFMPPRILHALSRFSTLNINVSFDAGSKDIYEKIRVGGKYDDVLKNVAAIIELVKHKTGSATGFCLSGMKSNIGDLHNFIELAARLEIPFSFSPVTVMPPDESICCFNDFSKDTAGWKEAFEKARLAARSAFTEHPNLKRLSTPELWMHYISVLENEVPWHLSQAQHHRIKIQIDPAVVEARKSYFGKNPPLLYVFPIGESWRGSALYWAPIIDGTAEISLPAKKFNFAISSKWKNPEPVPAYFAEILEAGKGIKFFFGPGFNATAAEGGPTVESSPDGTQYWSQRFKDTLRAHGGEPYLWLARQYRSVFPRL